MLDVGWVGGGRWVPVLERRGCARYCLAWHLLPTCLQAWCRFVAIRKLKSHSRSGVLVLCRARMLAAISSRQRAALRRCQLRGAWSRLQLNAEWQGRRDVEERAAAEATSATLHAQVTSACAVCSIVHSSTIVPWVTPAFIGLSFSLPTPPHPRVPHLLSVCPVVSWAPCNLCTP